MVHPISFIDKEKRIIMKQLLNKLTSYFPTELPTGGTAYDKWLETVVSLTGPIADRDSLIWVISNEIMRLPSGQNKVAKHYFVKTLRKFAANQIASNKVIQIKEAQQKQAADTAALESAKAADALQETKAT